MHRIRERFLQLKVKNKKALVPFVAAGDPNPDTTVKIMHALVTAGADLLELGIPFSDPMAEGLSIQAAYERALGKGISLSDVLQMVTDFRQLDTITPVILMGYLNPIEQMGYAHFAEKARAAGVDGVIIVDLSAEESCALRDHLITENIDLILLLAPTTSPQRMQLITQMARGYLYYVSLKGVTGSSQLDVTTVGDKIRQIKQYTDLPITVGFGIKTAQTAAAVAAVADGAVVGSALVDMVKQYSDQQQLIKHMTELVTEMRTAIDDLPV